MHVQEPGLRSGDVVQFLRQLLRLIPGNLLVIWDGSPIHSSHGIKDFLAGGAARRLHLERLPAYAPELTRIKAFGSTSSGSNCGTCAAPPYGIWTRRSAWPLAGCVASRTSFGAASLRQAACSFHVGFGSSASPSPDRSGHR